jgi:putative flippase GtrA
MESQSSISSSEGDSDTNVSDGQSSRKDWRESWARRDTRGLKGLLVWLFENEQIRYLAVAGLTNLFYLGLLALLLHFVQPYMVAILVTQVVTISGAFPLYRRIIFRSNGRVSSDFARFLGVWVGGAVAGLGATPLLVELLGWPVMVAQITAIVVVAVGSYLGHHFFSFRVKAASSVRSDAN